jgi:single-stranded-DNA-specific exonuclease
MRLQANYDRKVPNVILKLLKKRGIDNVNDFLSEDLKQLPNLTGLKGLQKSSDRVIQAVKNKEKIAIYGDYDVDGTTSCALLFYFFKSIKVEVKCIQPSRFIEGYGIHPPTIDQA